MFSSPVRTHHGVLSLAQTSIKKKCFLVHYQSKKRFFTYSLLKPLNVPQINKHSDLIRENILKKRKHDVRIRAEIQKNIFLEGKKIITTLESCTHGNGPWNLLPGGKPAGVALMDKRIINATVHPDLPPVTSLKDFFFQPFTKKKSANEKSTETKSSILEKKKSISNKKNSNLESVSDEKITNLDVINSNSEKQKLSLEKNSPIFEKIGSFSDNSSSFLENPSTFLEKENLFSEHPIGYRGFQVRTVAAQIENLEKAKKKMEERAKIIEETGEGGSLLLVSGGHPVRQLAIARKLLPCNADIMLREAHRMRQRGDIPKGIQLWAVENPLSQTVDSLQRKIEAGAEAIITQPPLLPGTFLHWWEEAERRGLLSSVPIIVGLPIMSSFNNFSFWLNLTNAHGSEADSILERYKIVESVAGGNELKSEFWKQEIKRMADFIFDLKGISGVHVMPVTPRGWRELLPLLDYLEDLKKEKVEN